MVARRVAPRPADAVFEHLERLAGFQVAKGFRAFRWATPQHRVCSNNPADRFGVVGRQNLAGQSDIGEVLAIGVERGVGQTGRAGESEAFSGGVRRPGSVR